MSVKFTEEQLNNFDKAMLIQMFLNQQEQLESIDNKMQLLLEQMADMNRQRFGRSSEKSDESNQLSFTIEDGEIIFIEIEAFAHWCLTPMWSTKRQLKGNLIRFYFY